MLVTTGLLCSNWADTVESWSFILKLWATSIFFIPSVRDKEGPPMCRPQPALQVQHFFHTSLNQCNTNPIFSLQGTRAAFWGSSGYCLIMFNMDCFRGWNLYEASQHSAAWTASCSALLQSISCHLQLVTRGNKHLYVLGIRCQTKNWNQFFQIPAQLLTTVLPYPELTYHLNHTDEWKNLVVHISHS